MLSVATDDLVTLDMLQVIHKYSLAQHIDQGLDVCRHFLLVVSLDELAKVAIWECTHEELHVELVSAYHKRLKLVEFAPSIVA